MKRKVFFLFVLLICCQAAFAYDFSAVSPSGQTLYYIINGCEVTVTYPNNSNTSWVGYSSPVGNLIIPNTVAYGGTTYSVTGIDNYAFNQCSNLTSVTIGDSVTNVGNRAFSGCTGLTSVVFNAVRCTSVPSSYNNRIFRDCPNITNFTFGNNVELIPRYLCSQISGLTSVTIPNSVTSIGTSTFQSCTGLTSVIIGKSVTSIGTNAFFGCTGLTSVVFNADSCTDAGYSSYTSDGTTYYNWAFKGCTNITSFVFGDNVKNIPYCLCRELTGLTSITIPDSVTNMDDGAFYQCSGLTSVTIGNSITSIKQYAFYQCSSLTSVTIPNSVTSIGNYAFYYCTGLTSLTIGNSVTSIGQSAFEHCTGFTSLSIPNSVTSIGIEAFRTCTGLTSVIIGNSVTYIGYQAFYGCGLTSITFLSPTPPTIYNGYSSAFAYNPANRVVYVPCGSRSLYANIISSINLYEMYYELFAVSADDSTGTVQILTNPSCSDHNAVISAVPADGYRFDHWSTGSTDNPYTLTVTSDTTITAFFEEYVPETYTVTVLVDNPATGSVTGGGVYENGTSVTITAYPVDGYHFDHWSTGCTENPYTLTVTSDTTITAFFEEDLPESYTVTVLVDNPGTGSVTGGGVYEEGTSVTITAYPADGYRFDHWSTGSTDNPYTLTVVTDTTIIGYFVSNSDINETEENDIHISVLNGQIYVEGVVNEEVRVYDITGRLVRNHSLPTGVYLVKVGTLPARKAVVIR